MPLNWDVFTEYTLIPLINTTIFQDFYEFLDSYGNSTARLNAPPLTGFIGMKMYFAYCLFWPWEFASNPVEIEIIP